MSPHSGRLQLPPNRQNCEYPCQHTSILALHWPSPLTPFVKDGSAFSAAYKPGQSPPSSSFFYVCAIRSSFLSISTIELLPSIPIAASDESSSARGILRSQKESRHRVQRRDSLDSLVAILIIFDAHSRYNVHLEEMEVLLGYDRAHGG